MAGISISILGVNDDRLRWLDAPTAAPAWPNVPKQRSSTFEVKTFPLDDIPATMKALGHILR